MESEVMYKVENGHLRTVSINALAGKYSPYWFEYHFGSIPKQLGVKMGECLLYRMHQGKLVYYQTFANIEDAETQLFRLRKMDFLLSAEGRKWQATRLEAWLDYIQTLENLIDYLKSEECNDCDLEIIKTTKRWNKGKHKREIVTDGLRSLWQTTYGEYIITEPYKPTSK